MVYNKIRSRYENVLMPIISDNAGVLLLMGFGSAKTAAIVCQRVEDIF